MPRFSCRDRVLAQSLSVTGTPNGCRHARSESFGAENSHRPNEISTKRLAENWYDQSYQRRRYGGVPVGMAEFVPELYPFRTEPAYRYYVWGGTRLSELMGKPTGPEGTLAESWEIGDEARVAEGPWQGKTLREVDELTEGGISNGAPHFANARLPLLIKLSGAAQDLSVQIHPSDEQALRDDPGRGFPGKTEMYLILDAEPGAGVYWGLRAGVTAAQLREACNAGTGVTECINFVPVKAGDVLFSPSGVVHALGKGIVFCEVQQNSDITYRLYDWGRMGTDGKPRPLHLDQGIAVIDMSKQRGSTIQPLSLPGSGTAVQRTMLCACRYFAVELLEFSGLDGDDERTPHTGDARALLAESGRKNAVDLRRARQSMRGIVVLEGEAAVAANGHIAVAGKGRSVVVPASLDDVALGTSGPARVVLVYEPDLEADVVAPLRSRGYSAGQIAQLGELA
jgi:mannose-6-phosphate isomerase